MDQVLNRQELQHAEESGEPIMRPFAIVAIACGIATLVGTFVVSNTIFKGLLIGGSLLVLVGSLLYYGLVGTRTSNEDEHPTSAPRPAPHPRRDGSYIE